MRVLPAMLLLVPALAWAEPVTYHWTGTVVSVTDGTNGTYDLRGTFSNGQAATFDLTVERSTPGTPVGSYYMSYSGAVNSLAATIGTYSFTGTFPISSIDISNDNPDVGHTYDDFYCNVNPLSGNPIGTVNLSDAAFTFSDQEGTSWSSKALPRPFPAMSGFEYKFVDVSWGNLSTQGSVRVSFDAVTTPAFGSSWGALKNLYRQ